MGQSKRSAKIRIEAFDAKRFLSLTENFGNFRINPKK
jgi:hypothetical protein